MQKLNLPEYEFNFRKSKDEKTEIFDKIRRKYVALTAEEWVRQNFIQYLKFERNVPETLISVEKEIILNRTKRRPDIVVFTKNGTPKIIVECKAPEINISQDVFDQITRYNITLQVDYLIVTNGMTHFCCKINYQKRSFEFLKEIPDFSEIRQ